MSLNRYVTSLNDMTNMFITREEVIEGLSTIFADLSGVSFSSINFGVSPNPSFSTITMPPAGLLAGFAPVQTSNVLLQPPVAPGVAQRVRIGGFANQSNIAVASSDQLLNLTPFVGNSFVARSGQAIGSSPYHQFLNNGIQVVDSGGSSPLSWMNWNLQVGSNSKIALNNISTINGTPVGAGITSYTNLSGNNLSNSQVITTPSIVGVSSLNALPISAYQNSNSQPWVSYAVTNTASSSIINFAPGLGFTPLSFSNIPTPTTSGREVTISVPIVFTITTPPSGVCNLYIQAFIGGSLTAGTSVDANVTITPATTGGRVTLCGVATTNGTQQVLNIQTTAYGGSFAATFTQGAGTIPRQFFFQTLGF